MATPRTTESNACRGGPPWPPQSRRKRLWIPNWGGHRGPPLHASDAPAHHQSFKTHNRADNISDSNHSHERHCLRERGENWL